MGKEIYIQGWLRPALTAVLSNREYEKFRKVLDIVDETLRGSSIEGECVAQALEGFEQAPWSKRERKGRFAICALRMELLRHLLGLPSFRSFSRQLSSSDLLADFCQLRTLEGIRWSSKSTLERASKLVSAEQLQEFNELLLKRVGDEQLCKRVKLKEAVDTSVCLIDSTCLEANIHFPVDWVLLKDVAVTLLKATELIRSRGLLHRMGHSPKELIKKMNKLSIAMTHSRRCPDAKKQRKKILRQIKGLLKAIGAHARRHAKRLQSQWEQTSLSPAQRDQVLGRIQEKLELLPKVIQQAHERIIGERRVDNKEKILSVHQSQVQVIVRGKSGKEVEFGNTLFIGESPDGLILDYKLYEHPAPSEADQLRQSLKRRQSAHPFNPLKVLVADRGFSKAKMSTELKKAKITDMICPRCPKALQQRLKEQSFRYWQNRRSSTEARIAILKNKGGGRPCRAKGYPNRAQAVGWGVLAHNLWWIARKIIDQEAAGSKAKVA